LKNIIKSTVNGIGWPALPGSVGAGRLAALFQLEQSQWWSREKIKQQQFGQLTLLLRHCIEHVPYYQHLLDKKKLSSIVNEAQWNEIPVLTRNEVQQAGNDLVSKKVPADHGKVKLQRTSGSTGKPVETLATEIDTFFWNVFTLRDHLWHQRDYSKKLAAIRFTHGEKAKLPSGETFANWGGATNGLYETGDCVMLCITKPIAEQITWLQKEQPHYLLTHPSVLKELALHCQREKIELPSLCEVRSISEALPEGLRDLCRQVWGVPLVDLYSTIELGYLALQCPEHEHYHVQSEGVFLEVLDENNQPCAAGEVGRVIVTNLHNFAFPMIRYEVGDYAEVGEPCDCGRGLPVIKRIMGRYRNVLITASGERRYPRLGIQDLYEIAPIRQVQVVQHTLEDITVKLVPERQLCEEEKKQLLGKYQTLLGVSFTIKLQLVESIERSASGKYEEFMSLL